MAYFEQGEFDVRFEWGLAGLRSLAPSEVLVILDVLSFTTCVDIALSRGASVFPFSGDEAEAAEYAREQNAILAGRRGQSEYSLSPTSLLTLPTDLRLVLPSPNGSRLAFEANSLGATVIAPCLRNAASVAAAISKRGGTVNVIAAGERWPDGTLRPAVEDLIGAGAVIKLLAGRRSPEAEAAVSAYEGAASSVPDRLLSCASGRELIERGFRDDVEIAAQLNVSGAVPVLRDKALMPFHE